MEQCASTSLLFDRPLLFNPGPTNVHPDVRAALLGPDLCHREEAFGTLLQRVCTRLVELAGGAKDHYHAVPFVASGTAANEAMLGVARGRMLVLVAGRYGDRLLRMACRLQPAVESLTFPPLSGIDPAVVATRLAKTPRITHLCVVHHETSTGLLAPLPQLGALCKRFDAALLVDGISSIGGHDFDLARDGVTMASVSSNKCLECVPGLAFLLARCSALEEARGRSRGVYLDVHAQWQACRTNAPLFTAATPQFHAMAVALDRLCAESISGRAQRYRSLRLQMEQGLQSLGIEPVGLPEPARASFLSLARLPESIPYAALRAALAARGITIYTDEETVSRGMLILATLGAIGSAEVNRFLSVLQDCIAAMQPPTSQVTVT